MRGIVEGDDDGLNPPSLAAAMNDEGSKEEANEERPLHGDGVLVMLGSGNEGEEEEEASDEEDGVVGIKDSPSEEEDVSANHPGGDGVFALVPGDGVLDSVFDAVSGVGEASELSSELKVEEKVGKDDGDDCLVTKMVEHEGHVPIPSSGYHEDRRSSEVSESSAD